MTPTLINNGIVSLRRPLFAILTAVLFLLAPATRMQAAIPEDLSGFLQEEFFNAAGEVTTLKMSPDEVTVKLRTAQSPSDKISDVARANGFLDESVVTLRGNAVLARATGEQNGQMGAALYSALSQDQSVDYVYPVYITPSGNRLFLNNQVIVAIRNGVEAKSLQLGENFGLKQQSSLSLEDNIHIFTIVAPGEINPLRVSSALIAHPDIVWAEPNLSFELSYAVTTPNDTEFDEQWQHDNTGTAPQTPTLGGGDLESTLAWDYGYGSEGLRM